MNPFKTKFSKLFSSKISKLFILFLLFFKNYSKKENQIIENYRDHVNTDLSVTHFIYVENALLTLIVNKNDKFTKTIEKIKTPVQNNIQHITYAKSTGLKAFESNIILDQIYLQLKQKGETYLDTKEIQLFENIKLSNKSSVDVFLVNFGFEMLIEASSQKFFKR